MSMMTALDLLGVSLFGAVGEVVCLSGCQSDVGLLTLSSLTPIDR